MAVAEWLHDIFFFRLEAQISLPSACDTKYCTNMISASVALMTFYWIAYGQRK